MALCPQHSFNLSITLAPHSCRHDRQTYNTYFEKTQSQVPESIYAAEPGTPWTSVLLNQTILDNPDDFSKSIVKMWIPRCYSTKPDFTTPCTLGYMMHLTLPRHDDNNTGTIMYYSQNCQLWHCFPRPLGWEVCKLSNLPRGINITYHYKK